MYLPRFKMNIMLGIMAIGLAACAASEPRQHQSTNPQALKPCPRSPNCVSSNGPQGKRYILPFAYSVEPHVAYKALIDILDAEKEATIVAREQNYIHAEYVSRIFRFVDDLEFLFVAGQSVVHVRSASRSGTYDFGVNRRRIERLRKLFDAALKT